MNKIRIRSHITCDGCKAFRPYTKKWLKSMFGSDWIDYGPQRIKELHENEVFSACELEFDILPCMNAEDS